MANGECSLGKEEYAMRPIEFGLIAALLAVVVTARIGEIANASSNTTAGQKPTVTEQVDSVTLVCADGLRLRTTFTQDKTVATCMKYTRD